MNKQVLFKNVLKSTRVFTVFSENVCVYPEIIKTIQIHYVNIPSMSSNIQRRNRHRITGSDDVQEHAMDLYTMRPFSFCTGRKLSIMGFPFLNHICFVTFTNCGTQTNKNGGEDWRYPCGGEVFSYANDAFW